jgi:NTE family protein
MNNWNNASKIKKRCSRTACKKFMPQGGIAMGKAKIAIACQGGGSQTAFTAGVLSSLLKGKAYQRNEIVGLSGTSGGAVCAALAWYGLLQSEAGHTTCAEQGLIDFWKDNAAQTFVEQYLNDTLIHYKQWVNGGLLPHWESSPYSPMQHAMAAAFGWWMPQFYDFRGLLEKQIDFQAVPGLIDFKKSPVLLLGATDVLSGEFKKFNSHRDGLQVEMILASSAAPSISKAVEVKNRAYWDGLFSNNPPTDELVDHRQVGKHRIPDQIWVIQINPKARKTIPQTTDEIIDRRNEIIGNASLHSDLNHICLINKLIGRGAFDPTYQKAHNLKIVDIYIIQMSSHLQDKLDFASKMDRNETFIDTLMDDGERQGLAFLNDPESMQYVDGDCSPSA